MKAVLAVRHVAFEDLGRFGPVLAGLGYALCLKQWLAELG